MKVLLQDMRCEHIFRSDSFTLLCVTSLLVAVRLDPTCMKRLRYLIAHLYVSLLCCLAFQRLFISTFSAILEGFDTLTLALKAIAAETSWSNLAVATLPHLKAGVYAHRYNKQCWRIRCIIFPFMHGQLWCIRICRRYRRKPRNHQSFIRIAVYTCKISHDNFQLYIMLSNIW